MQTEAKNNEVCYKSKLSKIKNTIIMKKLSKYLILFIYILSLIKKLF